MDRCMQAYCLISFNVWIDIMCTYICTLIPKHFSNSIISDHCFNSNTIQDESTISVLSGLSLTVLASLMLIYFPIYIGILGHYLCVLASLQTCHVITTSLFLFYYWLSGICLETWYFMMCPSQTVGELISPLLFQHDEMSAKGRPVCLSIQNK